MARLLLPEDVTIEHAQVGSLVLRPRCLESEAGALARLATSCEAFSLDAVDGAVLLVERSFARHLSNAMVGLPRSPANRPLSRVERGMVGGLAAVSLAKLGLPLGVAAERSPTPIPAEEGVCIHVVANCQGMDGHAWLCATASALRRAWRTLGIVEMLAPVSVEMARTQLPTAEALACSPGDSVVFDETPACPAAASLSADIRCRGKCLSLRLDRDGRVRFDDATAATRRIRSPRKPILQAGFVEVTAELAGIPTSSTTATRNSDAVLLRIGQSDWAEGLLGEQEDRLAVRISRILTKACLG
jgi:hypothetical protein